MAAAVLCVQAAPLDPPRGQCGDWACQKRLQALLHRSVLATLRSSAEGLDVAALRSLPSPCRLVIHHDRLAVFAARCVTSSASGAMVGGAAAALSLCAALRRMDDERQRGDARALPPSDVCQCVSSGAAAAVAAAAASQTAAVAETFEARLRVRRLRPRRAPAAPCNGRRRRSVRPCPLLS